VILVHHSDPADGPGAMTFTNVAVNSHLAPLIPVPASQIAFYERTDKIVVHTKAWIVDDEFAIIGSANHLRRSLYTDGEISIGVADEAGAPTNFVVALRMRLWGEHCGLLTPGARAVLADLDA